MKMNNRFNFALNTRNTSEKIYGTKTTQNAD
jgi:hypothetical protein